MGIAIVVAMLCGCTALVVVGFLFWAATIPGVGSDQE